MSEQLGLGKIITTPQQRDAIHIAVIPAVAGESLAPGERVGITGHDPLTVVGSYKAVGVVDPFLQGGVGKGEQFWLFLNPGSITSLRHDWTHPALPAVEVAAGKSNSELWMRAWAMKHMSYDYYGDSGTLSAEQAYANAIDAGYRHSVGSYEDARDHIDGEWWTHWEAITGMKGDRDSYFSCSC